MSAFTVTFCTDNAAFGGDDGGDDGSLEVSRILRELAEKIEDYGLIEGEVLRIKDINGNRVGFAVLQEEEVK